MSSEIVFMEEGGFWNDLQGISSVDDHALFGRFEQDFVDDLLFSFPFHDQYEDHQKPPDFYKSNPNNILVSSSSIPIPNDFKLIPKLELEEAVSPQSDRTNTPPIVQSKRRNNRHKMVVQQVTAEGLSSDKWAWRKYGQKPIKGSPYPRSYYRCSSSKGCMARKQVERNPEDPKFYIITYTAEHSHTHPTRRSSLAGSTRNSKSSKLVLDDHPPAVITTAVPPSIEEEEDEESIIIRRVKEEMLVEDHFDDIDHQKIFHDILPASSSSDRVNDELLFPSLEDMERLFLDQL
jgi:WRKY transcription factor 22